MALKTLIVVDPEDEIETIWAAQPSNHGTLFQGLQFNGDGGFWIASGAGWTPCSCRADR